MKPIITKTTQPTRPPVARVLIRACIILSTVALPLLLVSCPDEDTAWQAYCTIPPIHLRERNGRRRCVAYYHRVSPPNAASVVTSTLFSTALHA